MGVKQQTRKIEFVFKAAYLILAVFTFNIFTTATVFNKIYTYVVFAFGVLVFLFRLFSFNRYRKSKGLVLLIAFFALYAVSAVINFRYSGLDGLIDNAQCLVWMAFSFFNLYAYDEKMTKKEIKKELDILSSFLLVYNFIAVIISVAMLFTDYRMVEVRNGGTVLGGFLWNRLWGIYTDPNHGAVISVVCILLSMYFFKIKTRVWTRIFFVVNIALSLVYTACSDSRTGLVVMICGVAVYVYMLLEKEGFKKISRKAVKSMLCIVVSLATVAAGAFVLRASKIVISETKIAISQKSDGDINDGKDDKDNSDGNDISNKDNMVIGRENSENNQDISEDVSNRRFSIWRSGLDIISKAPLFGSSFRGMVSFAEKQVPDTYILNNDQGRFNCMHNSLLDVLVSQGILGFGVFVAFGIVVFLNFCKNLRLIKREDDYLFVTVVFSAVAVLLISSLFISQIIYINSIGGILFWIFLGYLTNYVNQESEPEEDKCTI